MPSGTNIYTDGIWPDETCQSRRMTSVITIALDVGNGPPVVYFDGVAVRCDLDVIYTKDPPALTVERLTLKVKK